VRRLSAISERPEALMEWGRTSITPRQLRQSLKHGVAIHFELAVGKGVAAGPQRGQSLREPDCSTLAAAPDQSLQNWGRRSEWLA
jgi:hypothetical protein